MNNETNFLKGTHSCIDLVYTLHSKLNSQNKTILKISSNLVDKNELLNYQKIIKN
jgi:hypothetical protein